MKKFFAKILVILRKLLGGVKKFNRFLETHVDDAIDIAKKIREFANDHSAIIDTIFDILPVRYQDASQEVLEKIMQTLDKAIVDLAISKGCLEKETLLDKIKCFVEAIRERSELDRNGAIQKLATAMLLQTHEPVEGGDAMSEHIADNIVVSRLTQQKNETALEEVDAERDLHDDDFDDETEEGQQA